MTSHQVFEKFVPTAAVDYCNGLYENMTFEFKVTRSRRTKLGDFRFRPDKRKSIITVNNDLNPYAFLVTYLHEVAHLTTFKKHGYKVAPHGNEWKQEFINISEPMLTEDVFPSSVLDSLIKYFQRPKASSCSDPDLYQALRQFDPNEDMVSLKDIENNQPFIFHGKKFVRLEKKRTRWLCGEIKTERKYLISGIAEVELIEVNS